MPKPLVTGISPKDGYPGTKVTIRGEFLGKNEQDLIAVKICSVDCTLRAKWEKESRITTYTSMCIGKGDIVIITQSGGVGTSSVGFTGLIKKSIGPTEETSVWIEEDPRSILSGLKRTTVNEISHDNPLSISIDESSRYDSDFMELEFPNSSIDITKSNFNAMRFLLENYQSAKFEDLKSGLNYLKTNVGAKTANSSDNLLKTNISSFMDAINIMKDIHALSSKDKKNDFTRVLDVKLKSISKSAHKIYDQDLASKDKADMIRNSIQILENYKSLIYFPQNIDKYLKVDDFEAILIGFKQASAQLNKAEAKRSRLFMQIKSDLNKKMIEVQESVLKRLVQFPSNPDDQKLLIDFYNALQLFNIANGDAQINLPTLPGWYCLEEEKKWFINLMIECRDMFIADEKVSIVMKQSDSVDASDGSNANKKVSQTQQKELAVPLTTSLTKSQSNDLSAQIQAMTQLPHERNKFIEELCEMFFDIFTDYWRLGTMYLNNLLTLEPTSPNKLALSKKSSQQSNSSNRMIAANEHTSDDFYALVGEILNTFSNIVRAAFIPHTFKQQAVQNAENSSTNNTRNLLLAWPIQHDAKVISQILPHCLRVCRICAMQINSLEIPLPLFETIQNLIYDLRCECLKILLLTPTHEILAMQCFDEQEWVIERDIDNENNCCLVTSLPARFESKMTKALSLSKEFVLDDRHGEKPLFRDSDFVNKIAMLIYGILHSFLKRIGRFMTKEEQVPKYLNINRSKLLLYLYNDLTLCKRKILPNIWNIVSMHKYKLIDQVIKESKKNVKELQDSLLKQYMLEVVKPITDSIEGNLYAGHYDFSESSVPTAIRNYIKLIIMSLLNVHSELFLLNKSLITVVFSYAVKEIYMQLLKLFANVPNFGAHSAIQTYVDIFCLSEAFKVYNTDDSKEIIQKIIKLIPSNAFEANKKLMARIISDFQKNMQPYIAVLQQQPPPSSVTISFVSSSNASNASSTPSSVTSSTTSLSATPTSKARSSVTSQNNSQLPQSSAMSSSQISGRNSVSRTSDRKKDEKTTL